MTCLLQYERNILLDIHDESCMLVCCEGLDLDNIIHTIIKLHSDPHNLVLISNYCLDEARYISQRLMLENEPYAPFVITADVSVKERKAAYNRGGVVFVSSRILVVDLLRATMPVHLVTGVFVLRCHRLHEASQEVFMIRLLRESKPDVFVKAFTDNPVTLMSGYNRVEAMMNQFGTPKLLLWPRFNVDVVSSLSSGQPIVDEIQVYLSENVIACQSYLLQMIKATLNELVENNPILKNDEFSLETALTNSFNQLTSLYIDPVWHQLTQTSHRLLADVAGLRRLLFQLIDSDAVGFLDSLEGLRQAELAALRNTSNHSNSSSLRFVSGQQISTCANWLLMSEADKLLSCARQRVYKCYKNRTYSVELSPKLTALHTILKELLASCQLNETEIGDQISNRTVLILVSKIRTAELIAYFLKEGEASLEAWLVRGREECEHPADLSEKETCDVKLSVPPQVSQPRILRLNRGTSRVSNRRMIRCGNMPISSSTCEKDNKLLGIPPITTQNSTESQVNSELLNIDGPADPEPSFLQNNPDLPPGCHSLQFPSLESNTSKFTLRIILRLSPPGSKEEGASTAVDPNSIDGQAGRLAVVLNQLRPKKIVFFEPHIAWVRQVEVYAAREHARVCQISQKTAESSNCGASSPESTSSSPIRIYFMVYKDSVEEQRYLTSLRREKESFESLIKLRSSVVIRKLETPFPLRGSHANSSHSHSAIDETSNESTILVDVREFRSELPALLHRKGIKVQPLTLSIGDYIIAPHICVERKSVNDLISSLNTGRLYQQCTAMSRNYINPVLLVEFSMPANGLSYQSSRFSSTPTGSFALFTGRNAVATVGSQIDLGPRHLMSKLVLLTIHFPNLRILWSVTPYCTAELFAELKLGRAEPTIDKLPQDGEHLGEDNVEAVDMLLKMPGISWRNYRRITASVESLAELSELSLDRLSEILDNRDCARQLFTFLHSTWTPEVNTDANVDSSTALSLPRKRPRMELASKVKPRPHHTRPNR